MRHRFFVFFANAVKTWMVFGISLLFKPFDGRPHFS